MHLKNTRRLMSIKFGLHFNETLLRVYRKCVSCMEHVFTVTETGCKDVRWIEENNEVLRGKKCIVENVCAVR